MADFGHDFVVFMEAEDGKEALQLYLSNSFDAIITDIRMPAIDGLSLLKEIHAKDKTIPVILVSTYSNFEYAKEGIAHGAFDYVVKPFDKDTLFSLFQKLKVFLDKKTDSEVHQSNVNRVLSEKLVFGIHEEFQDRLFFLLLNHPSELDGFVDELVSKYLAVYNNDYFKLGVAFENLLGSIEEQLLTRFAFVSKIYTYGHYSKMHFNALQNENAFSNAIKSEINKLSAFISLLHLNQTDIIIKRLCEYALMESERKPTLDEAAILLNYNSDYLGKLFKLKTGESFSHFSAKVKLEHAKMLLLRKAYKNYEISEMLGYKDVGYFSKLFKEYTGLTPTEYKKLY